MARARLWRTPSGNEGRRAAAVGGFDGELGVGDHVAIPVRIAVIAALGCHEHEGVRPSWTGAVNITVRGWPEVRPVVVTL